MITKNSKHDGDIALDYTCDNKELWLERVLNDVEKKLNDEEYEVESHFYHNEDMDGKSEETSGLNDDVTDDEMNRSSSETDSTDDGTNTYFLDSVLTCFFAVLLGGILILMITNLLTVN